MSYVLWLAVLAFAMFAAQFAVKGAMMVVTRAQRVGVVRPVPSLALSTCFGALGGHFYGTTGALAVFLASLLGLSVTAVVKHELRARAEKFKSEAPAKRAP